MSSWDPTKIKTKIKKASSSSPSSSSSSSTLQDGSEDENELGNLKVREELNSTVKNSDPLYDKVRVDGYNLLHEKDVYASRSIIMCVLDTDVWSHVCECMYVPPPPPVGATAADLTESRWTQDGNERQVRKRRGTASAAHICGAESRMLSVVFSWIVPCQYEESVVC